MIVLSPDEKYYTPEIRDGFRIAEMTKRYMAVQLKVLSEIDSVCEAHGIRWFAEFGTLLGAVRHHGFIPWDDDMDIAMFRDDYKTFLKYAVEELPSTYRVFDVHLNPEYDDPLGRVVNNGRIQFDPVYLAEFCGCPYTAGIDIFLLDGIYDDPVAEENRCDRAKLINEAYRIAGSERPDPNTLRMLLLRLEQSMNITIQMDENLTHRLAELRDNVYSECDAHHSEYISYMSGWTSWGGYKRKRSWYDEITYLPFETVEIPVPKAYDEVLSAEYGDYMTVNRGGGAAHPYPVYRMQQEILMQHLREQPDDRLSAYLDMTSDKHMEHDARCTEIFDMCDQVLRAIENGLSSDITSVIMLLQGMIPLMDSVGSMIGADYSPDVKAMKVITAIKSLISDSINEDISIPGRMENCVSRIDRGISYLKECVSELYHGHGEIDIGDITYDGL